VAFLCLALIAITCARRLFSKDTNMSAKFEEKRELMFMNFLSRVTNSDERTELKAIFRSAGRVLSLAVR
jgi:hypothetical protein